jgi:N-acetylglucosamine kinase-like BadF-type ATPase
VGLILGVDGGNSKTELLAATTDGERVAYIRGPGSNSHSMGAEGVLAVVDALVDRARLEEPAEHGALFLCGADIPADIAALERAVARREWVRSATVDNDTFALLRAGTDAADAVAVVCGTGINCVGRASGGRVARYPSLGWETGDWGGAHMVGREALFLAARAADGRGEPTALTHLIPTQFGLPTIEAVGEAAHYRRGPTVRISEIAPLVLAAAEDGDPISVQLVDRLAEEIALLVGRAFADLDVEAADVVLGGGMLTRGDGLLHDEVVARLPGGARPVVLRDAPVLGAALAALDAAVAAPGAGDRLRAAFRERPEPENVRAG